jgi:hypothetical protein
MDLGYRALGNAWRKISNASGAGETTKACASFAGDLLWNTGRYVVTEGPGVLASVVERQLKERKDLSPERREQMQEFVNRHKK